MNFTKNIKRLVVLSGALFVTGCMPLSLELISTTGDREKISFYPGGENLDDLIIMDDINYFGKAQFQVDDPLSDIGFRFNDGRRVQAECVERGEASMFSDEIECKKYSVYRSNFDQIAVGTYFFRPELY